MKTMGRAGVVHLSARRALLTTTTAAAAALLAQTTYPTSANAWCGNKFPPFAYTLPFFEFNTNQCFVRVVGDLAPERKRKLAPLLVIPSPQFSYQYLENLEAITVSQRRVIFVQPINNQATNYHALGKAVAQIYDQLEIENGLHLFGHGLGASIAISAAATAPGRIRSLIAASPIGNLQDAESSIREELARSGAPLLASTATQGRDCIDAELSAHTKQSILQEELRLGTLPSLPEIAGTISAQSFPVLITRGAHDVCQKQVVEKFAAKLSHSRIITFKNSGPAAFIDETTAYGDTLLSHMDEADGVTTRRAIPLDGIFSPVSSYCLF